MLLSSEPAAKQPLVDIPDKGVANSITRRHRRPYLLGRGSLVSGTVELGTLPRIAERGRNYD